MLVGLVRKQLGLVAQLEYWSRLSMKNGVVFSVTFLATSETDNL